MRAIEELIAHVRGIGRRIHCEECERLLNAVEAELAARGDERVIVVNDSSGIPKGGAVTPGWTWQMDGSSYRFVEGKSYAIRPLPDPPKPETVRPWRCRPGWVLCPRCYQLQRDIETCGRCCEACRIGFGESRDLPEPVGEGSE